MRKWVVVLAAVGLLGAGILATAVASGRDARPLGNTLQVVAAENVWGSIAAQLGGSRVSVLKLDPADRAYFAARKRHVERVSLGAYNRLRAEILRRFAGVPVGYSQSIFQPLGQSLGLKLLTPYSFAKAISEGTEISARDKQTVDAQGQRRLIKVWVYNSQNATPDIQRINAICRSRHIPVATVTETLSPASDSFEQWQVAELQGLIKVLHEATGR